MQDHSSGSRDEPPIYVIAYVKPESIPFFNAHGCTVEPHPDGDRVIFPVGSRQERLTQTSTRCSTITLPDETIITMIDRHTRALLLVIDVLPGCHTTHLTW